MNVHQGQHCVCVHVLISVLAIETGGDRRKERKVLENFKSQRERSQLNPVEIK